MIKYQLIVYKELNNCNVNVATYGHKKDWLVLINLANIVKRPVNE